MLIDTSTGFLAGPLCPRASVQRIRVPADAVPSVICPIHNPEGLGELGTVAMPDVLGLNVADAVATLSDAGYGAVADWDEPGPLAPGTVYGQDPGPGAAAAAGITVRLTVAGPAPGSVVPSVLGLPPAEAQQRLAAAGLTAEVVVTAESDPDDAAARRGLIWAQQPAAGSPKSGSVTVWVNP